MKNKILRLALDLDGVILTTNVMDRLREYVRDKGEWTKEQEGTTEFKDMFADARREYFRLIRENLDKLFAHPITYACENGFRTIEVASYSARQNVHIDASNIYWKVTKIWGEGRFDFDLILSDPVIRLFKVTTLLEFSMIYLQTLLPTGFHAKLEKSMLLDYVEFADSGALAKLVSRTKIPMLSMHLSTQPDTLWVFEDMPCFVEEITQEEIDRCPGKPCDVFCTHVTPESEVWRLVSKSEPNPQSFLEYCKQQLPRYQPMAPALAESNTWQAIQSSYR